MSEREYSAHSGLSRGSIKKARKAGRLVVCSDGSINAAASDVRRAEMTDPDQQRLFGSSRQFLLFEGLHRADRLPAQECQQAIQKKKGRLVDCARAETVVFRLARQERDTWVTWPGR